MGWITTPPFSLNYNSSWNYFTLLLQGIYKSPKLKMEGNTNNPPIFINYSILLLELIIIKKYLFKRYFYLILLGGHFDTLPYIPKCQK